MLTQQDETLPAHNIITNEDIYGTHQTPEVIKEQTLTEIPEKPSNKYISPYSLKALSKPKPKKVVKKATEQSVIDFTSPAVADRYLTSDTKQFQSPTFTNLWTQIQQEFERLLHTSPLRGKLNFEKEMTLVMMDRHESPTRRLIE